MRGMDDKVKMMRAVLDEAVGELLTIVVMAAIGANRDELKAAALEAAKIPAA